MGCCFFRGCNGGMGEPSQDFFRGEARFRDFDFIDVDDSRRNRFFDSDPEDSITRPFFDFDPDRFRIR